MTEHGWPPTRMQWIGAAVGLAIGVAGAGEGSALAVAMRLVGYPVAVAAIVQWVPIVRRRRTRWFVAHQAGMLGIVGGWALTDRTGGVAVNGLWFVVAAIWWAIGSRRGQLDR